MSSEYVIPHPNVPTTDIGIPKLKESVTLFNENFLALDAAAQENASAISDVKDAMATSDHDHDDKYAPLEHTHTMSAVEALEDNLALKAPLVHEHSQYLTSLPEHTHGEDEITNLVSDLAGKAEQEHTHNISDVTNLDTQLAQCATQAQLAQLASSIPRTGTLDNGKFVAVSTDGTKKLETPDDQPMVKNGTVTSGHAVNFTTNASGAVVLQDAGVYAPGKASTVGDAVLVTAGYSSVPTGNLLECGDSVDIVDSGLTADEVETVVDSFDANGNLPVAKVDFGSGVTNVTSTNVDGYISQNTTVTQAAQAAAVAASAAAEAQETAEDAASAAAEAQETAESKIDKTTADGYYQAKSGKLTALNTALDSNGKVPLTQLTGNISGHSGTCYVTIDGSGNLGHSENRAYNLLNAAKTAEASALATDKNIGSGIQYANSAFSVKCKSSGGITATSDGLAIGGMTGTGVMYNTSGTLSYKSVGNGSSYDIASGSHTHDYSGTYAAKSHAHGNVNSAGQVLSGNTAQKNKMLVTDASGYAAADSTISKTNVTGLSNSTTTAESSSTTYLSLLTMKDSSGNSGTIGVSGGITGVKGASVGIETKSTAVPVGIALSDTSSSIISSVGASSGSHTTVTQGVSSYAASVGSGSSTSTGFSVSSSAITLSGSSYVDGTNFPKGCVLWVNTSGVVTAIANPTIATGGKAQCLTFKESGTAPVWEEVGGAPEDPGSSKVNIVTTSYNTTAGNTTTWSYAAQGGGSASENGLTFPVITAVRWTGTKLIFRTRLLTFDKNGMLYSMGAEQVNDGASITIDTPTEVVWA